MIGWTNVGNSLSGSNNNLEGKARLRIKAPTGSVISISKDGNVIKTLDPSQGKVDVLDDYWSYYTIQIDQANYDEYTVNSLFNNRVNTRTVEITESNLYDIIIPPVIIIIKDGAFVDGTFTPMGLKVSSGSSIAAGMQYNEVMDNYIRVGSWSVTSSSIAGINYYQILNLNLYKQLKLDATWVWYASKDTINLVNLGIRLTSAIGTYQTDNSLFYWAPYLSDINVSSQTEERNDVLELNGHENISNGFLYLRSIGGPQYSYYDITNLELR